MFKKLLAAGLSLTLILSSGAIMTLANVETNGQKATNTSKSVDGVDTTDSYGAVAEVNESAGSDEATASIKVTDDVSVDFDGSSPVYNNTVSGVSAESYKSKSEAEASIGGNVDVKNSSTYDTEGVSAYSRETSSSASATVGGNVSVTSGNAGSKSNTEGASAYSVGKSSSASTNVGGNVTVNSGSESVYGIYTSTSMENSNSTVDVSVEGDVTVSSNHKSTVVPTGEPGENLPSNSTNGISAFNYTGDTKITVGKNIEVTSSNDTGYLYSDTAGVNLYNEDIGKANINVDGNITVIDNDVSGIGGKTLGIYSENYFGGVSNIDISKNITVTDNSVNIGNSETLGISIDNYNGSISTINVGGNINVTDNSNSSVDSDTLGIWTDNYNGGILTINVDGNIDVTDNSVSDDLSTTVGILSSNSSGSILTINVGGNVNVTGSTVDTDNTSASGISAINYGGGKTTIDVDGNVTATGKTAVSGIDAIYDNAEVTDKNNKLNISVHGDVTSSGDGVYVSANEGGNIDVLIEGTLTVKDTAVVLDEFDNSKNNLNITAWKIVSPDKTLVKTSTPDPEDPTNLAKRTLSSDETSKAVESSINYIIKIDNTNPNGSISLYSGTTKDSHNLDVAKEGQPVAVKLDIPDGFTLRNVYGNKEQSIILTLDQNGDYFLVVPSGGGVYINMVLDRNTPDNGGGENNNSYNNSYENSGNDSGFDYFGKYGGKDLPGLPSDRYEYDNGVLKINLHGMSAFSLSRSVFETFIAAGLHTIYIDADTGKFSIPYTNIKDLVEKYELLNFVISNNITYIYVNQQLQREFYADKSA